MRSTKYGRTYHYPFSPGTTSDDRFNHTYWEDIQIIGNLIHTEKLDGENNCLSKHGVFARSHAAPTTSAWTEELRKHWQLIRSDLGNLELFGENIYAVHSIEYQNIESYYHLFAVRCMDRWLGWEEVKFYAQLFDFPTVPELITENTDGLSKQTLQETIIKLSSQPSVYGSVDIHTGCACTREGVVTRNAEEYAVDDFMHNVFKYVRKGHVKTDEHWSRNWVRAKLIWEKNNFSRKEH